MKLRALGLVAVVYVWGCSNEQSTLMNPNLSAGSGAAGVAAATSGAGVGSASAGTGALPSAGSSAVASGSAGIGLAGASGSNAGAAAVAGAAGGGVAGSVSAAGGGGAAGSAGASAGAGGSAGAAGGGSAEKPKPACLKKSSQVIFIGDSYINYGLAHTLLSTLIEQRAIKDGALKSGETYRNYAVPGTALAAPNALGMIAPQWDMAVAADPDIKFVIMDGGGNDVLLDNRQCLAAGSDKDAACQKVVADSLKVGADLMNKMKAGGVTDDIYFFYPHVPAGGDDINDYGLMQLQAQAMTLATPTFRTYVEDTIPLFEGHPDYFASDGIHANDMGENLIADQIWKTMKDNCIAQPESSGCCTP
jgi:hypothetical protein